MTHIRTLSLIAIAALTLSACGMSEGIDADSDEGVFTITHTTKGTVYLQLYLREGVCDCRA